ncbi:MAG: CrcB family protein [Propionibacteriaceae bacterium]|jgi:CrcB protein|nr:CrcB family protein [Propionibacteriaceae bacterium]
MTPPRRNKAWGAWLRAAAPRQRRRALKASRIGVILLGGALGASIRVTLSEAWPAWTTTLAINLAGAFLLGALLGWLGDQPGWRHLLRLGLGTGVLGGFTTYSAFSFEIVQLLRTSALVGVGYALGSVLCGVAAACLGGWATARMARQRGGQ